MTRLVSIFISLTVLNSFFNLTLSQQATNYQVISANIAQNLLTTTPSSYQQVQTISSAPILTNQYQNSNLNRYPYPSSNNYQYSNQYPNQYQNQNRYPNQYNRPKFEYHTKIVVILIFLGLIF